MNPCVVQKDDMLNTVFVHGLIGWSDTKRFLTQSRDNHLWLMKIHIIFNSICQVEKDRKKTRTNLHTGQCAHFDRVFAWHNISSCPTSHLRDANGIQPYAEYTLAEIEDCWGVFACTCTRYTAIMRHCLAVISQFTEAANQIIRMMNTPPAIFTQWRMSIWLTDCFRWPVTYRVSLHARLELVPTWLPSTPPPPPPAITTTLACAFLSLRLIIPRTRRLIIIRGSRVQERSGLWKLSLTTMSSSSSVTYPCLLEKWE